MKRICSLFILLAFLLKVSFSYGGYSDSTSADFLEFNSGFTTATLSTKKNQPQHDTSGLLCEEVKFEIEEDEDKNSVKKPELLYTFLFQRQRPIKTNTDHSSLPARFNAKTPIFIVFGQLII